MSGVAVGLRQPDRKIDGGVVGHFEKQDLRCANEQRGLDARRLRRRTAFEKKPDQMAQGAKPPQHGRDQRAGQGAVALGKAGERSICTGRLRIARRADDAAAARPSTMSAATRRAARPGTSSRLAEPAVCRRARFIPNCSLRQLLVNLARLRQVTGDANRPDTAKARRRQHEDDQPARKPLSPAAERALAEAAARRAERDRNASDLPKEIAGRDGPEPTRYGDWEINGLTSDF